MFLGALETFKVVGGFAGYVERSTCEIPDTLSNPTELQFPSLISNNNIFSSSLLIIVRITIAIMCEKVVRIKQKESKLLLLFLSAHLFHSHLKTIYVRHCATAMKDSSKRIVSQGTFRVCVFIGSRVTRKSVIVV